MPESMTDRLSSRHEHLFMLTKSARYWFDLDAIREEHEHAIAGQKGAAVAGTPTRVAACPRPASGT